MTDTTLPITAIDLRDYFAAKAMQAYLAKSIDRVHMECYDAIWNHDDISAMAYEMADAMLETRQ